jgi:hypothetical protein
VDLVGDSASEGPNKGVRAGRIVSDMAGSIHVGAGNSKAWKQQAEGASGLRDGGASPVKDSAGAVQETGRCGAKVPPLLKLFADGTVPS